MLANVQKFLPKSVYERCATATDCRKTLKAGLVIVLALWASNSLFAQTLSDTGKEQRWAEQVIDTLFDGEPVWLEADGHEFLAIEMESFKGNKGRGVIVIHGIGIHPNWDSVIRPLRVGLTNHGWHTLSIQMSILPNDAESAEYLPLLDEVAGRINAAIDYLHAQGQPQIVIAAHSLGATMTMRYMGDVPNAPVSALVLIGMQGGAESVHDNAAALEHINLPVLDIYGSDDLPGVVNFANRKAAAANAGANANFQQIAVDGADHFFTDLDDTLVNTVSEWLTDAMSPL